MLILSSLKNHVLTLTLNRPQVRNALNSELINEFLKTLNTHAKNPKVRVVVLQGSGGIFCSGGDIQWLKKLGEGSAQKNLDEAKRLAKLFYTLNDYPKPIIGLVQGGALGGGFGLVCVCDYVIATKEALFSLSEMRIGIVPSVILPFVLAKIGESQTRALMLTGEKLSSEKALSIGLIHKVVDVLSADEVIKNILLSAPKAITRGKKLLQEIKGMREKEIENYVSKTLADIRAGREAQEGLAAFLEKRKPSWS